MSFPGKLLRYSIKTQIIWTTLFFSLIGILLINIIINSYIFEIKERSIKNHREYYYTIQKDILQNIISFQNMYLFNYQDTLINLISELYNILTINKFFEVDYSLFPFSFKRLNYSEISDKITIDDDDVNDMENSTKIYYMLDKNISNLDDEEVEKKHQDDFIMVASRILLTFESFRIPHYGDIQLFDGMIIYLNKTKEIYCLNYELINDFIKNDIGSNNLDEYYNNLINTIMKPLLPAIENILANTTVFPDIILESSIKSLLKSYNNNRMYPKFAPYIDYKKELLHFIRIDDEGEEIYISAKFKEGIIDDILMKMMKFHNTTTLLISAEDNTILNVMSCYSLFMKLQIIFLTKYSEKQFEKYKNDFYKNYENILKKNVTFDKCFLDYQSDSIQNYIGQYLNHDNTNYFESEINYNFSFIKFSNITAGKQYMAVRYSYPELLLLERKHPRYLLINFIKIYTFMNFLSPFSYVKDKSEFLMMNFYAITISSLYLWIIIFVIIIIICFKLSKEITQPLINLKNAIEKMSFKDNKIFEYKDDDSINELFVMCKDLVNTDQFKDNMKGKYLNFLKENKLKTNTNSTEIDEKNSLGLSMNKNLIINNQLLEENRKIQNREQQYNFEKEIIEYKDFKFLLKMRPRALSRKRPKTELKLGDDKSGENKDAVLKKFSSYFSKNDFNIKSKIRDKFLNDSMSLKENKKNSAKSFREVQFLINNKINKNDNELNTLFYELLFFLGKKMFKPKESDIKKEKVPKLRHIKSLISNNDINSEYADPTKNSKNNNIEDANNKFYNYPETIFESNDFDNIYEERKSKELMDKERSLKEEYQILFKKNNLYYKYLRYKNKSNNNFINKYKKLRDLELDSNAIIEIEDDEDKELKDRPVFKKSIRKSENINAFDRNSKHYKKIEDIEVKTKLLVNNKKSNIKNYSKSTKTKPKNFRKSTLLHTNLFDSQKLSNKQKKLGMRASVSANIFSRKELSSSKTKVKKKTKFNLNVISNYD